MKAKTAKSKRLNRWSYFIDVLITVPVLSIAINVGREYEYLTHDDEKGLAVIAQLIAVILASVLIVWTVRRLHDLGKSGWFAFFLAPPFTFFLWIYLLIGSYDKSQNNKWGEHNEHLRLFGIKATSIWQLLAIMATIFMIIFLGIILYGINLS